MNSFEKYNCIISEIEKAIEQTASSNRDIKKISDDAFAKAGLEELDERSRNEIIKFLLGETLSQYIARRIIMLSYKALMAQVEYDCEEIKKIVGVSSDSALYKKYKEYFGMTPREAFERKIGVRYENPRYWNDLSNTGKVFLVNCIEKEIEIPMEKIIRDRRPYLYFSILVAVIAIAIVLTVFYAKRYERWGGRFDIFCKYITEMGEADFYNISGNVLDINPIFNTINLVDFNTDKVILKGRLKKVTSEKIAWKWNGQEREYWGEYNLENCSIECGSIDLVEECPNAGVRLFHQEDYEDIYATWTGTFSTFAAYNGIYADLEIGKIYIDTDVGILYFEAIPEELYVSGRITFLSEDTLRFKIPGLSDAEFVCNYQNGGYFESDCPLFCPIEDIDLRFYRVTRYGVSKLQDITAGIIERGQAKEIGE